MVGGFFPFLRQNLSGKLSKEKRRGYKTDTINCNAHSRTCTVTLPPQRIPTFLELIISDRKRPVEVNLIINLFNTSISVPSTFMFYTELRAPSHLSSTKRLLPRQKWTILISYVLLTAVWRICTDYNADLDPGSQTYADPCGSGSDFKVTKILILT
jgi:hypothetical protein